VDLSKLNTNDWLIGGGAIAFLISIFLPWYGIDEFGVEFNNSGSEYLLTGWLPLALLIIAFVLVVLPKLSDGINLPEEVGPLSRAQAALAAAGAAAVLVVLRLIIPSDNIGSVDADVDLSRKYGLFLALLAVIAAAAGAFLNMQSNEDAAGPSSAPPTPF
jgi:4-amino-4-deoxy-L-arabinose transferase-like glycosyltransferase